MKTKLPIEKTSHSPFKAKSEREYLLLIIDDLLVDIVSRSREDREDFLNGTGTEAVERALRVLAHARKTRDRVCLTVTIAEGLRKRDLI